MMLDSELLYSLCPQEVALSIAKEILSTTIVDAFCGAGGLSIGFAREGKRVIALDINKAHLEIAKYNAKLFGVADLITFKHEDALRVLHNIENMAIFLDPPWGGPNYTNLSKFKLENFIPSGRKLLDIAFTKGAEVGMRVPKNFDFDDLASVTRRWRVQENYVNNELIHYCVYWDKLE
ncbi:MAG: RsmD family RNA methyltransferase [Planctomycetota bacterium]